MGQERFPEIWEWVRANGWGWYFISGIIEKKYKDQKVETSKDLTKVQ